MSYLLSFITTIFLVNFTFINLDLLNSSDANYKIIQILFIIISFLMLFRSLNLIIIGFIKKIIFEKLQIVLKLFTNITLIILTFFLLKITSAENTNIYYICYFFSGLFLIYNFLIFLKFFKRKKSHIKTKNIFVSLNIIFSLILGIGYFILYNNSKVSPIYPDGYFNYEKSKNTELKSFYTNDLNYTDYLEKYDLNSDYFLLANNLSKIDVLYLSKNYSNSKNIIENIDKNTNYNFEELKEVSLLNLILANYYIKIGELSTSKEVYINTIENLEYIINSLEGSSDFSNTYNFYSVIIQNIINDLEANNKIFKIKDLRLILNSIPEINTDKYFEYIVKNDLETDENLLKYENYFNVPFLFSKNDFFTRVYNYSYNSIINKGEYSYFDMDKLFLNYITNFEAVKNCKNYSSTYTDIENLNNKIIKIKEEYN